MSKCLKTLNLAKPPLKASIFPKSTRSRAILRSNDSLHLWRGDSWTLTESFGAWSTPRSRLKSSWCTSLGDLQLFGLGPLFNKPYRFPCACQLWSHSSFFPRRLRLRFGQIRRHSSWRRSRRWRVFLNNLQETFVLPIKCSTEAADRSQALVLPKFSQNRALRLGWVGWDNPFGWS